MWYVYILQCKDGSLYTGVTTNLPRRFKEHVSRIGGKYTRAHKVKGIVYTEKAISQSDALKREAQIKGWRREKKLNLIQYGKPVIPSQEDYSLTIAQRVLFLSSDEAKDINGENFLITE